MIKGEIIGKLIKDGAFAEYLIKSNLGEYDILRTRSLSAKNSVSTASV